MLGLRIYAAFKSLDEWNRVRLNCAGTCRDLQMQDIQLQDGMALELYTDDADELGQPVELRVDSVVQFDQANEIWVARVDWSTLRHASQEANAERNGNASSQTPRVPGAMPS